MSCPTLPVSSVETDPSAQDKAKLINYSLNITLYSNKLLFHTTTSDYKISI